MMKSVLKINPFSIVTTLLSILCLSSSGAALFAEPPLSEAAFIVACLFWLCLPLAIYQELFYFRYRYLSRYFQSDDS